MADYPQYSLCIEGVGLPLECVEVFLKAENGKEITRNDMRGFPEELVGFMDILNAKLLDPNYVTNKFFTTSVWDGEKTIDQGFHYRLMGRFRDMNIVILQAFLAWVCQFSVKNSMLGTIFQEGSLSPTLIMSIEKRVVEISFVEHEYPPKLEKSCCNPEFLASVIDWEKGWGEVEVGLTGKSLYLNYLSWDEIVK